MTCLNTLTLREFLRHAHAESDELTASDIEREALRRLEAMENDAATEAYRALEETEFSAKEVRELAEIFSEWDIPKVGAILDLLSVSYGISEVDELKEELEIAKKFQRVANDLAESFEPLTTLIKEVAI